MESSRNYRRLTREKKLRQSERSAAVAVISLPARTVLCFDVNANATNILRVLLKAIQIPQQPPSIQIFNYFFTALFNKEELELLRP